MNAVPRSPAALYTPELLGLAVRLAEWPWREDYPLKGEARSRTCGSALVIALAVSELRVTEIGLKVSACAVGQAAAAIFAGGVIGRSEADLRRARDGLHEWLAEGGTMPDWPNLAALRPVLPHNGRHGAVLLPWDAALDALPKSAPPA